MMHDAATKDIDMTQSPKKWGPAHFEKLHMWLEQGMIGEEIMRRCNIGRRDTLKALIMDMAEILKVAASPPSWGEDVRHGQRNLPRLKAGKNGDVRISGIRFKRHGFQVKEGDCLILRETDTGMLLMRAEVNLGGW